METQQSGQEPSPSIEAARQRSTYLGVFELRFVRLDLHIHAGPHTEANKAAVHTRVDQTQTRGERSCLGIESTCRTSRRAWSSFRATTCTHTHALSTAMLAKQSTVARKSPTAVLTQAMKDAEHAKRLAHSYSQAFSHIPLPPWPFDRRRSAPRRPAHDTNSQDHTRTGMEAQGRCMPRKNDGGFYERAWRKKRGNQRECGYEGC